MGESTFNLQSHARISKLLSLLLLEEKRSEMLRLAARRCNLQVTLRSQSFSHMCVDTHTHTHTHTYIYMCMYVFMHRYTCIYGYMFVYMYMQVYVYACIYIYKCIHVNIYLYFIYETVTRGMAMKQLQSVICISGKNNILKML